MARLSSLGSELNTNAASVEWTTQLSSGTIGTTPARSGTYGVDSTTATAQRGMQYQFASATSDGPFYARAYIKIVSSATATNPVIGYYSGTATLIWINLLTDNTLTLQDEDGVIGSASSALDLDTWYLLELGYDRTPAAGSEIATARLNGIQFASGSNRNLSTGFLALNVGKNLKAATTSGGQWYFDDIAINDSTGSFQNSWPGEGEIIHLRPNAVGDNEDWTGAADNYALVDEVTPDDATTSVSSTTVDNIDDYNIDAIPAAMDTTDTINCVQVGVRFRMAAAQTDAFVVRIKASASGTVEESANIDNTNTTWYTNKNAVPRNYPLTLYDLPGASTTAYTPTDLDTTQIGIRLTVSGGALTSQISTLWLLVDHKPTAGGGTAVKDIIMSGIIPFAR